VGISSQALSVTRAHVRFFPDEDEKAAFDLVVTDVLMPRGSGRSVVERLRAARPGLPALYVSGYTDAPPETLFAGGGPDAFLAKPFTLRELAARIRDLLRSSPSTQAPRHGT
jgi:DNA-binding response OmpR family regulator